MRTRIHELAGQAKLLVTPGLAVDDWINEYNEKFAELIVQECISTLDRDDGATHHSELLLEHFGVE